MIRPKQAKSYLLTVLLMTCLAVIACSLNQQEQATLRPTSALSNATPESPSLTTPTENAWEVIAPGMEQRVMQVRPPLATRLFDMVVVRFDPALVRFRVHYVPQQAATIQEWSEQLEGELAIVNANFFTESFDAVGLVVADGFSYGQSFDGFGGMFRVLLDESIEIRALRPNPYAGEASLQAVQGFPMLINPPGESARTGDGFDDLARRTILAQDQQGRILILITPLGEISLRNAQRWLAESDLGIVAAFGLDGGKSSGLYVARPDRPKLYNSIEAIPVVLAVYPL